MSGETAETIRNVMIDRTSGKVVYATMAFGGVLGMGQKYHALQRNGLDSNPGLDGFQIEIDLKRLEQGPAATEEELTNNFRNKDWSRKVYHYYGSSWGA